MSQPATIRYRRVRFSTLLPVERHYAPAHFWLVMESAGVWKVGFTRFATRMLGDLVELEFSSQSGEAVDLGQPIGSVEGFKAITELYAVVTGQFLEGNPAVEQDITLIDTDCYGEGWLYRVRGEADPSVMDVHGYMALLDDTIDRMTGRTRESSHG